MPCPLAAPARAPPRNSYFDWGRDKGTAPANIPLKAARPGKFSRQIIIQYSELSASSAAAAAGIID